MKGTPLLVDAKNQEDKRLADLEIFLQDEIWANIPEHLLGTSLTKAEEEAILGYGEQESGTEDSVQEIAEYWGDASIDEIYAQVESWKANRSPTD